jgi:hypothetical protein
MVRKRVSIPLVGSDIFQVIRPAQNPDQLLDVTLSQLYSFITSQFASGFVPTGRTLTINGVTYDLTQNRSWTVAGVAAWGSISGVITNQLDLLAYLAANYQPLGNYVPTSRTITINGVTYDLSVNRNWTVGTVTGVTATLPITSSGGAAPNISSSMASGRLIGRGAAGVGPMEEIILGTNLSLVGNTLNATGGTGGGLKSGTASGTNTYTVTIAGVTSYTNGDAYVIKFTNGNDDDSSININGLGAKNLEKQANVRVTGGDIVSGQELIIIYDGTHFQCLGIAPNQLFAYVTNDDSVTINKGQPVYAFGAAGNRMSVKLASNTSDSTSAQTVGVVFSSSIAPNQKGFIITQGVISGLNTAAYSPGAQLYLGATAGTLTSTKPVAPNHLVYIGIVERANAGNGQIYIKPQNGYELDELHDVLITSPLNNQVLAFETGTPNLWKNKNLIDILPTSVKSGSCGVTFDGGGQVILNGKTAYVQIPYNGTLGAWSIVADQAGACTITVSKGTYTGFPTSSAVYSTNPAIPAGFQKATNAGAYNPGMSTITAGDVLKFDISAITSITWVNLSISITKI